MRQALIFSSLIFSLILPGLAEAPSGIEYRVTEVSGEAGFLPRNGTEVSPAVQGLTLEAGDRLVTGKEGHVQFATKEGTVMELKENSNLQVESFSSEVSRFFLRMGKLLGKFAPTSQTKHSYNIHTPVAVAAVRGTELAMCVEEDGRTEAGVIEGQVAFGPSEEAISQPTETEPAIEKPDWKEGEILVGESKGIVVKSKEKPEQLSQLPPIAVQEITWFPHIRERIPSLKEQWKDLTPPARMQLRQQALRERIKWKVPENLRRQLPSPREQIKDHFSPPAKLQPNRRRPRRPLDNRP
jgi:hypothetical protein